MTIDGPNQFWVADIVISAGFVYLASILDAWSRRVFGYMCASLRSWVAVCIRLCVSDAGSRIVTCGPDLQDVTLSVRPPAVSGLSPAVCIEFEAESTNLV